MAKLVVGEKGMEIPQIVAHLSPSLKDNKIAVTGKIVIQNPTRSSLDLDKIYLEILDENKVVLAKATLDWSGTSVTSHQELEAPVAIDLDLAVLNNKSITVFIRTGFTYKTLGLHIPVESKVAVLHLNSLKETVSRPLYVNMLTRFHSTLLGNSSIDFTIGITNPLSIDLFLADGLIRICTPDGRAIAQSRIDATLFKGSQANEIRGSIRIGNIWNKLTRREAMRKQPLKFQMSGRLEIPNTDIFIPFKIESTVEANLSFS